MGSGTHQVRGPDACCTPASCQAPCRIETEQPQHLCTRRPSRAAAGKDPRASCFLPHDEAQSLQMSGTRAHLSWVTKGLIYRQFPSPGLFSGASLPSWLSLLLGALRLGQSRLMLPLGIIFKEHRTQSALCTTPHPGTFKHPDPATVQTPGGEAEIKGKPRVLDTE